MLPPCYTPASPFSPDILNRLPPAPCSHETSGAADMEDAVVGDNPLDLPVEDFNGSIVSGSEPVPGSATLSPSHKTSCKLSSSASASSVHGNGSLGGGGDMSEFDSLQDSISANDVLRIPMEMDNNVSPFSPLASLPVRPNASDIGAEK